MACCKWSLEMKLTKAQLDLSEAREMGIATRDQRSVLRPK